MCWRNLVKPRGSTGEDIVLVYRLEGMNQILKHMIMACQ